jgi:hypothetical protein
VFGQALASGFANTTANGGYGSHGGALVFTTGLAYVDSISAYNTVGAILLIAQDTTPGKEFFCWALKTHGLDNPPPEELIKARAELRKLAKGLDC